MTEDTYDVLDEYSLDMHDIMIPSYGINARPNNVKYGGVCVTSEGKANKKDDRYHYKCEDCRKDKLEVYFDIYYAPFFFVAVFDATTTQVKVCVVNGISFNGNITYTLNGVIGYEKATTSELSHDSNEHKVNVLDFSVPTIDMSIYSEPTAPNFKTSFITSAFTPTNDYSFSMTEGGPDKKPGDVMEYARRKLSFNDVRFVDDADRLYSQYDVYYYYSADINGLTEPSCGLYKDEVAYKGVIDKNCRDLNNLYELYISKVDVDVLIKNVSELDKHDETLLGNDKTLSGNDEALSGALDDINDNIETVDTNTKNLSETNKAIAEELGKLSEDLNNLNEESEFDIKVDTGDMGDISGVTVTTSGITEEYDPLTEKYKEIRIEDTILDLLMYDLVGKNIRDENGNFIKGHVVGVFDNWTRRGCSPTWANLWDFVTKHKDILAVVKYYSIESFRNHLREYLRYMIYTNFS
jgi:hypothetical protein